MTGRIVVGVDGSEPSRAALRWAMAEADLRGAALEAVHCYAVPIYGDVSGLGTASSGLDEEGIRADAQRQLDEILAEVSGRTNGKPVLRRVDPGPPSTVLTEAAAGADLVVVGARGLGSLRSLLLGSVSQHVAHHAACPVVIVRA
jgi:nucleotide-binding universal stress UspA family protein